MNIVILNTLTSTPAKMIYKQIAKYTVKTVAAVSCEVATYFAAQKIIKEIKKETNFEPVETCTIRIKGSAEA